MRELLRKRAIAACCGSVTAGPAICIWRNVMNKRMVIASAVAAAVAAPSVVSAQAPVPPPKFQAEKCYGLAKAGKNDCASTGNNSCGGSSKVNADPRAWIYVPVGYCERIVGGSLKPKA
jgi:uncharacterized membrane protein